MLIRTPADLGAAIRAGRRAVGLDQAGLAARVGVQRQWIIKIESGKPTAEVGLVLRTLNALGLQVDVGEFLDKPTTLRPPAGLSYDIDAALERTRPDGAVGSIGHGAHPSVSARQSKAGTLTRPSASKKHRR
jgi:HTH-type transcriptional regulator / antitoxin HipB